MNLLKNLGYILHCKKCLNRIIVRGIAPKMPSNCPVCGGDFNIGGPLWCGEILILNFIIRYAQYYGNYQNKSGSKGLEAS